jgi:hypothetical protein
MAGRGRPHPSGKKTCHIGRGLNPRKGGGPHPRLSLGPDLTNRIERSSLLRLRGGAATPNRCHHLAYRHQERPDEGVRIGGDKYPPISRLP